MYVCEKASVGKALAGVLPGIRMRDKDYIRCGDDIVAWASGHLLEMCEPEDYDPAYRQWSRGTLLYVPDTWKLKEKERTKALLSGLKKLIKGLKPDDVIVNAGDSDREGTTLVAEILDYCGWQGRTLRLRINDMNPDAIRKALDSIRDDSEYRGEYMAGMARMRSDWLVGLSLTRFVTVSLREAGYYAGVISVGRVQTPTLGLVVERDREIRDFVPQPYYDLMATIELDDGRGGKKIAGRWIPNDTHSPYLDSERRIASPEWADGLAARLDGAAGVVTKAERHTRKSPPPLPYSLSKLQMAASKKYDITDALVHTQKLYESGYVTYPRTSCEYIPEGHFADAPKVIDAIRSSCPSLSDMMGGVDLSRKGAAWDTSKISEHHAIIPTLRIPPDGSLTDSERKTYELICARYALQFLPDCEYEETVIEFEPEGRAGEKFRAAGRAVINPSWQGWDKQDAEGGADGDKEPGEYDDGAGITPSARQGETGTIRPSVTEKATKPPKPYTYHSLIGDMNNIHRFVRDPEIRAKLKEVQGIGTEATQEGVISILFKRGYLEKRKRQVLSTPLGRLLIGLLGAGGASVMVRPDLTALWERKMDEIGEGLLTLDSFVDEVAGMVRGIISGRLEIPPEIPRIPGISRQPRCLTDGCGGFLRRVAKPGRSAFYSCPLCHATFNDAGGVPVPRKGRTGEAVEAPCPMNCGRNARRYEGRYGHFWKCVCSPGVTFRDSGGVPVLREAREARTEAPCPVKGCKGRAARFASKKDGRLFWKCAACDNFFDDVDGVPVLRETKNKSAKS